MTNHAAFSSTLIAEGEAEDYGKVLNHLMASSLVDRGQLWPRGELVQPHTPCYFKPDTNLYRDTFKKDRRNGKGLEYIHSAGTWLEEALCALELFKKGTNAEEQGRLLFILEESLRASNACIG